MAEFDSLPAAPVLRTCVQYLIAVCSRPEAAIGLVSGRFLGLIQIVPPDKRVKFRDPRLKYSGEIQPKGVR